MNNMTEYLNWRGDISMESVPLCEADYLVAAQLAYIPYDGAAESSFSSQITVGQAAEKVLDRLKSKKLNRIINFSENAEFLHAIIDSPRFSELLICGYTEIFSVEKQEQFCAMTFLNSVGDAIIAFRGTDSTLIGWKEDFNMAFSGTIPAQLDAVNYIQRAASELPDKRLHICGHSKGGNLAVYGSAFCGKETQDRIVQIRNLDGPGFSSDVIHQECFISILDKVQTIIPASSIVGILLEHAEDFVIIQSYANTSPFQHDPFTWEIRRDRYVYAADTTDISRYIDSTLKQWVVDMSPELREQFINGLFEVVEQAGVDDVRDIFSPKSVISILRTLRKDPEAYAVISEALSLFQNAAGKGFPAFIETLKRNYRK